MTNLLYRRISNFKYCDLKVKSFVLIILIISPILLTGCATVIGFSIGSAIDRHKKPYNSILETEYRGLAYGKKIRLTLADSTIQFGKFAGFSGFKRQGIDELSGPFLPCRGDSIKIIDLYGRARITKFGALYYKTDNNELMPYIELDDKSQWVAFKTGLFSAIINSDGDTLAIDSISAKLGDPERNSGLGIIIKDENEISIYPVSEIEKMGVDSNPRGSKYGLLSGVILDIAWYSLIYLFLKGMGGD